MMNMMKKIIIVISIACGTQNLFGALPQFPGMMPGQPVAYQPPVVDATYRTSFTSWKFNDAVRDVRETLGQFGTKIREEVVDHRCSPSQTQEIFSDLKDLRDRISILKVLHRAYSDQNCKLVRDYTDGEVRRYKESRDQEWARKQGDRYLLKIKEAEKLLKSAENLETIALEISSVPPVEKVESPAVPPKGAGRQELQEYSRKYNEYQAAEQRNKPLIQQIEPFADRLYAGSREWFRALDKQEIPNRQGLGQIGTTMYFQAKHSLTWIIGFLGLSVPGFFAEPYDRKKAVLISVCMAFFIVPLWGDYLAKKDEVERFDPEASYSFIEFLKTRYGTRHKLWRALKTEKKFWAFGAALAFLVMPQVKNGVLAVFTPERRDALQDRVSRLWSSDKEENPFAPKQNN